MAAASPRPEEGQRRVRDLMKREFVTMSPEDTLLEAERIMRLARIRHMPIVDGGLLVGVLSHRDVVESAVPKRDEETCKRREQHLQAIPVADVMRANPFTADLDTTLREAAKRMLSFRIGCLPVVETSRNGPQLVGLITESDLLRAAYAPDFQRASD